MRRLVSICALLATGAFACGKTGDRTPNDAMPNTPVGGTSNAAGGTSNGTGTGGSATMKPGEPVCIAPGPGPNPGPAPLSALGNFELNRSLRALFGATAPSDGLLWLVEEPQYSSPFSREAQPVSPRPIHALAHDLALQLSNDATAIQAFSGCDPLASGDPMCATSFIEAFVARAYRRPLTQEDRDDMKAVFAEGQRLDGAFKGGVRAVVEVALQSPEFLYLVELGENDAGNGTVELTGSETAARLAYFLTASPPDAELSAAASQGALSPDTLEDQARRLLGSPASRELVRHFYDGMLRLRTGLANDPLGYTPQIAVLAQEESLRFVEDVTFDGAGTFRALLTEPSTWVNAPLAQFYGLPGVAGTEFRKVALDPTKRGGILTQAAFLRSHAHQNSTDPVRRGLAVLRDLLCVEVPPPPPDVPPLTLPVGPEPVTIRGKLTVMTQDVQCRSCHDDINPLGFAFEHYDAVGKWQDTENGQAVDSSGVLVKTDAAGTFADAIELLKRIADSDDAKACFVGHWLAQAYRRPAGPGDACAVEQVAQAFAANDGNLVELMVALAKSDNLRYRLKSELSP
jgi:hypothetical protein